MHVYVVFAHPTKDSFTGSVLESFIAGLGDAGHTYEIGEFIYHQTWRDVGKVISRRELAGGRCAIDVAFLNYGPKMLIVEAEEFVR